MHRDQLLVELGHGERGRHQVQVVDPRLADDLRERESLLDQVVDVELDVVSGIEHRRRVALRIAVDEQRPPTAARQTRGQVHRGE